MFEPTVKQAEVYENSTARTNLSVGAVRSGKTKLCVIIIPKRMEDIPHGECGLFGKTLATLSRNVLKPLREYYSEKHISDMKRSLEGAYFVTIFGREFICVGANDKSSETKIRGSTLVYAYCDEISTWDEGFFQMLLSRLDSKDAKLDGTTNPDHPNHWLKKYIDKSKESGASVKTFNFHIDDNPTLDRGYVENLKKTYAGTVYYDRFIEGRWAAGQGSIYKNFTANPENYIIDELPDNSIQRTVIGIDFGMSKSRTSFKLIGFLKNCDGIVVIDEFDTLEHKGVALLERQFLEFYIKCRSQGYIINNIYYDNAQPTLGKSLQSVLFEGGFACSVEPCIKKRIQERINAMMILMGSNRFKILSNCVNSINAFKGAVYNDKLHGTDERLDDGTSDIDSLDAIEYAYERDIENLINRALYNRGDS